jgi:hypothetical protein
MLLPVPAPRRPLRVLHTADIHLGSDGYGNPEEQAAHAARVRQVLQGIVDCALTDRVDLLLIAGDLFDHDRVPDETIAFVRSELDRLRQPVVILPGNHDRLRPKAIYDRHDFSSGASHVHVIRRLDGEVIEFADLEAIVWGRAMEEHEPAFQPLAHIPARADGRWCIALGHGFFYPERQRPERSSPIFADEIRATGWDYVALGHHHHRIDVSQGRVAAHYAGAPGSQDGAGPHGTVLRVDLLGDGDIRVEPRPLAWRGRVSAPGHHAAVAGRVHQGIDQQRAEEEGAARERRGVRPLVQHQPDPQRAQDDLQHPDEARLGGGDDPRTGHEEQEPDAELADAEERQEREVTRRGVERVGERERHQSRQPGG